MNVIFGIVDQCDTKIDLVMYSQVSDLHFVVQMILPYVLKVCVIDLYYFDILNDGASRGYSCPPGTCSSLNNYNMMDS